MIINDTTVVARQDTGAEGNFILETLALRLALEVQNEEQDLKMFSTGNGAVIRSIGSVKARCAFLEEPETSVECVFHVFRKLSTGLIMGMPFLEATRTLTIHRRRLHDRYFCSLGSPVLNLINSTQATKQRLACEVDRRLAYVNADSASDLDLVSLEYAESHKDSLPMDFSCRKRVQLADTTIVKTVGQISASILVASRLSGKQFRKHMAFDVLPNLSSDVVFGEETLEEMLPFIFYKDCFVAISAGERQFELNILTYLGTLGKKLLLKTSGGLEAPSQINSCECDVTSKRAGC